MFVIFLKAALTTIYSMQNFYMIFQILYNMLYWRVKYLAIPFWSTYWRVNILAIIHFPKRNIVCNSLFVPIFCGISSNPCSYFIRVSLIGAFSLFFFAPVVAESTLATDLLAASYICDLGLGSSGWLVVFLK